MKPWHLILSLFIAVSAVAQNAPPPKPMTVVIYQAGPKWMQGKPAQEQNLAGHFAYADKQFKSGSLIAYGTQADAVRGFYVLNGGDETLSKNFIATDPATIKDKVLAREDVLHWNVVINAFSASTPGQQYFLLRYKPGANWVKGKHLSEQNIGAHFGYIMEHVGKQVIAGGPLSSNEEGLYVISAPDHTAADAFIAADPGVREGIFKPVVIAWNLINMQVAK